MATKNESPSPSGPATPPSSTMSSATPESRAAYLARIREELTKLGVTNTMSQDPQTGKPGSPEPTMEKPEGSNAGSSEASAPVPSADKPGFEGDGGYVYDVDDKTKTIKILKSPRSAGGQSVTPGSSAYAAIAKELNDKYQLGLDVPSVKPAGFKLPSGMGSSAGSSEAGRMPGRSAPASDWKPPMPEQPPTPTFSNMADKDKDSSPSMMDNVETTLDKFRDMRLPNELPLNTGLKPNTTMPGSKTEQVMGAMGAPPLAPPLAASMKRLGFPGDASQGITPELVQWLASLPDASLYNPSASAGNALEMIKAIAASSTGVNAKDYGKPNGQSLM